ncbi:MAG TPA: NAD(P)-dependent oxidoreductase [Conexibacter sp.]|nr:NAD(P)-dependent oxidoreductase [Conexibacter sp.]
MSAADARLRIGWIGTGRMGFELAGRLLDAGADLAVWNRTAAKAQPLVERGATLVGSPAELADRDVVFTMVSASDDLKAVTLGEGGVLTAADAAPGILIDSSTVSAEASQEVRVAGEAQGTVLLAAPISGNPAVVASGKASVAVSGPWPSYERARPYLEALGKSVTYVGEGDAARTVKIAHNVMLGIVTQALAEIVVLAEQSGVKRSQFLSFLNDSVMGSPFTRYKTPALVSLELAPTFTPALLRKDLDLGLDAARSHGAEMPITQLTRDRVQALIDDGVTDLDFAALILLQAKQAGLELKPEPAAY